MTRVSAVGAIVAGLACSGCAGHLVFGASDDQSHIPADAVGFYDQTPAVITTVSGDCTVTTTLTSLAIPGGRRWVKPVTGYGSSQLSANFSGTTLTSFGQTSDNKVPETITAIGGLAASIPKVVAAAAATGAAPTPQKPACIPESNVYQLTTAGWSPVTSLHAEGRRLKP